MVDGDFDMQNGIRLFKMLGHTLGGMVIQVQTSKGKYVITGDMPHLGVSLFPKLDKMELMDGTFVDITPAPDNFGPYIFNSVIYDYYEAYDSFNKLSLLAEKFEPQYYLTGHDIWCVRHKYFGV
jgi:glyoxylase-like metal-dependent hydrolase (beta-lactamase superfamily II)